MPKGKQYVANPTLEIGWETHLIKTEQGREVMALTKSTTVDTHGIVFLLHPYTVEAKLFFLQKDYAKIYLDMGYRVVVFDFNGFGDSPFFDFNFHHDVSTVVDYFEQKFPDLIRFGHGISFGGANLITYAKETTSKLEKIIIENALDTNLSYYKKRNKKLYIMSYILTKFFPGSNKNHNYVQSIAETKSAKEVLFIYNTEDDLTTITMGRKLEAACKIPSWFEIFEGKHLQALELNREKYVSTLNFFLFGL